MRTPENMRKTIAYSLLAVPKLGENYINWQTEDGKCGLTIIYPDAKLNIVIDMEERNND